MQKKLLIALSAVGMLALAGCGKKPQQPTYPDLNPPIGGDKIADFAQGECEEFFASDGWSNGQPFNAVWTKDNITYSGGQMHLGIKDESKTVVEDDKEVTYPHTAGAARSHKLYGYGDFQVRMKPTNVVGSVSTFFTYTDKWNSTGGVPNKHDEIDIEFLGKDTTKVQFNYFVGGVGGHEYMYDLGFDASQEFHTYGFRWEEDKISWVVDGKTAHVVEGNKNTLPSMPGRIISSYWPSSADSWSGHFDHATSATVDYEWIKSSAPTSYADGEEPVPPFDEHIDWSEVNPFDVTFWDGSAGKYTETVDEGAHTFTYEEAGNWACVGTYIGANAAGAEAVNITLFNNSSSTSTVKVDVQGEHDLPENPAAGEAHTNAINVAAYANGHTEVSTDVSWGGSKIEIEPREEVQFIIQIDQTTDRGALTNLAFFFDSLQGTTVAHPGGSITVKDIKFAKLDGTPIVPPAPTPGPTPGPDPQPQGEDLELTLNVGADSPYTVDPANTATKSANVKYTSVGGSSYANFGAPLTDVAGKTSFAVTFKNNGTAPVKARVDVLGTTKVGNTQAINTSASAEGHTDIWTDTDWGGSSLTLAVGEEVEFVVAFDQSTDRGAATYVNFFLDSAYGDSNTYSGDLDLSHFKLGGSEPAPAGDDLELTLNVGQDSPYTVNPANTATKSANVTYTSVGGSSYANFGAPLTDVEGKTSFAVTLKNNGTSSVKARVDVLGTTKVGNTQAINTSATAEGHTDIWTDTDWGGSSLTLAVGEEVEFVINFDQTTDRGAATYVNFFLDSAYGASNTYSGDLDLSHFKLNGPAPVVDDMELTLNVGADSPYTVDPSNTATATATVTYTSVSGSSYANFGGALTNVEGKTKFSVTLKNNGSAAAKVRVDVLGTTKVGNTQVINTSASAEGHTDIWTDTDWGGSSLTLAAGEEVEFVVTFDQTTDRGTATYVNFFIDSFYGDANTYSGSLALSHFKLA